MFTQFILALSALSFVAAGPASKYPGAPANFDPTFKYPSKFGTREFKSTGGAHYNATLAAAHHAVRKISQLSSRQPPYGPGSYVADQGALSWYNSDLNAGTSGVSPSSSYTCFSGYLQDYPPHSQWMNFYTMFNLNQQHAMAWTGSPPDTGEQQGEIYNAIVSVSQAAKVDARLILAVIIQESGGWVNVQCTAGYNCGLMQANHGSVSYNPSNSQASINQMVTDGVEGTTQGPGYVQYLNGGSAYTYTHCASGNPYAAARAYNTGSCSKGGNMNCAQWGTASYTTDVANRLIGWDGTGSPQGNCGFPAVGCV